MFSTVTTNDIKIIFMQPVSLKKNSEQFVGSREDHYFAMMQLVQLDAKGAIFCKLKKIKY